jgi:two-component system chemotaxis sensor kinase CheA
MARDPYKYFRVEARELLDQLGAGFLDLEKSSGSPELIARLLRVAHTLKGAARVVKQIQIGDLAHRIEDVLAPHRESDVFPAEQVNELLSLLDRASSLLAEIAPPPAPANVEPGHAPQAAELSFAPLTLRSDAGEMDTLLDGVTEAHVQLATLARDVRKLEQMRQLADLLSDQLSSPRMRQLANGSGGRLRATSDELAGLAASIGRSLTTGLGQLDRELRQVRETAERLRLLPVGQIFTALERTARDVALSLGKRVAFEAHGGDVRLDAPVLALVQNALVQVVRNAVAHGIEVANEREIAGKPSEGRVSLRVSRRGNQVVFRCEDDGRGVDLEAVRRAAEDGGLDFADARALGSEQLIALLLKGGISTARSVTSASGRGVGLDVVREAMKRLNGEVRVQTSPGQGTGIDLVVPVSLSSLDALLVEAAGQIAAIPLDAVRRAVRLPRSELAREASGRALLFDGALIPFASLEQALQLRALSEPADTVSLVVLDFNGELAAIGVDRLLGAETVMLRRLPDTTPAAPVVVGASLDGEGNPQVVLDPEHLVRLASQRQLDPVVATPARVPILVIDDSLTTRMLEQSILESAGYAVDVAASAEEGLEKARMKKFALILVDVEMPGMDGFEFVEKTQLEPSLAGVPSILVTSRDAAEDRRRGEVVGARGYMVKSEFDQRQLLDRIQRLLER